ncbi:hypothetical protein B0H12DRAFT_1073338 [Mycena haematopus]|nr:hypothetical protein B0H12DRAFT_1073338 [Mycena haematopus]
MYFLTRGVAGVRSCVLVYALLGGFTHLNGEDMKREVVLGSNLAVGCRPLPWPRFHGTRGTGAVPVPSKIFQPQPRHGYGTGYSHYGPLKHGRYGRCTAFLNVIHAHLTPLLTFAELNQVAGISECDGGV